MTVPEPQQYTDPQQWLAQQAVRQTTALESIKIAVWILVSLALVTLILGLFISAVGI